MSGGKIEELIKQKRAFLMQTTKGYSAGGNDMLDDVETLIKEAKTELAQNLELAICLREESEESYQKECIRMLTAWYEKYFGET